VGTVRRSAGEYRPQEEGFVHGKDVLRPVVLDRQERMNDQVRLSRDAREVCLCDQS
jgi:hypothetical protein